MTENSRPFALDISASVDVAFDISETLDTTQALSVSLFDTKPGHMIVQALYDTRAKADAAQAKMGQGNIHQMPDTDWVSLSQSGLPPVKAGRFVIYGSHDAGLDLSGRVGLLVDAGMAFGTGHHGTTAGCLRIYSNLLDAGFIPRSVLDLGCGAGVLAIAAAKTVPQGTTLIATDIDQDAVDVTLENARINAVEGTIIAAKADGFESPALTGQSFDLIFANILAGPLMGLAPDIVKATAPGGYVILSGILDDLAPKVASHFTQAGLNVTPQPSLSGWTSLLAVKPTL